MKIVIPMSGLGSRFIAAGYTTPKPLIMVDGKPIIAHVLDMFSGEDDVIFICNEDHLAHTNMSEVLQTLKPNGTIVPIKPHKKGPVYAVSQIFNLLSEDEDVMVSYCDFGQKWDFAKFKKDVQEKKVSGAIPCYTGFHPHLLHGNLYAGILADKNGLMTDIQEKHCFTENPEDSYHSGGSYYFSSGALVKKYFIELMDSEESLNGEFYVSMVYYLLQRDELPVYIPTVDHFMQWGTPEDLEEYEAWMRYIHTKSAKEKQLTDIPSDRENRVKIIYTNHSPEFIKSEEYWTKYIDSIEK